MQKLCIAEKTDSKLLQNFPQDPYYNIIIQAQEQEYRLHTAYLILQSSFFEEMDPTLQKIDLKHLHQESLTSVLRTLYGGELIITSIDQLQNIMIVIDFLKVNYLRQSIKTQFLQLIESTQTQQKLLQIEILQFSFKNNLLKKEISQLHFKNQLLALGNSKNYLQLGKITQQHLNQLLLGFYQKEKEKGKKNINTVMENYFNRKNIRATIYLQDQELQPLKNIWEHYHHKISHRVTPLNQTYPKANTRTSAFMENITERKKDSRVRLNHISTLHSINMQNIDESLLKLKQSQTISQQKLLDVKLQILSAKNKESDDKIKKLTVQLKLLKIQLARQKQKENRQFSDITLLENIIKSKYSKQQKYTQQKSYTTQSTAQNAFEFIKIPYQDESSLNSCFTTPKFASRNHFN